MTTRSGSEITESLASFDIVSKPADIRKKTKGKYHKLLTALQNLANDKSIRLSSDILEEMGVKSLAAMKASLSSSQKRYGIKATVIQGEDGYFYAFTRS